MVTAGLCNSCSPLTLNLLGSLLCYLLTSLSSVEDRGVNKTTKTFFWPFFFWLDQFPDPACSSAPWAALLPQQEGRFAVTPEWNKQLRAGTLCNIVYWTILILNNFLIKTVRKKIHCCYYRLAPNTYSKTGQRGRGFGGQNCSFVWNLLSYLSHCDSYLFFPYCILPNWPLVQKINFFSPQALFSFTF